MTGSEGPGNAERDDGQEQGGGGGWVRGGQARPHVKMGSGTKGACASWHRMWAAAAWPKSAGVVPSTGMVRTRKFGTTCAVAAPAPQRPPEPRAGARGPAPPGRARVRNRQQAGAPDFGPL